MHRVVLFIGLFGIAIGISACGGSSQEANSADSAENHAAIDAAQSWLAALDAGNYDASWNQSATVFRAGNGSAANWASAASEMRGPLGNVVSRRLKEAAPTNLQEGAAYGLVFETSFAARPSAVEEVTVVLDGGFWKVAGYMVK
jgi:hypothetical protein